MLLQFLPIGFAAIWSTRENILFEWLSYRLYFKLDHESDIPIWMDNFRCRAHPAGINLEQPFLS